MTETTHHAARLVRCMRRGISMTAWFAEQGFDTWQEAAIRACAIEMMGGREEPTKATSDDPRHIRNRLARILPTLRPVEAVGAGGGGV